MIPSEIEDVKKELGAPSTDVEMMQRAKQVLQPMQDHANQLNSRQNVMGQQAGRIVSELKQVANSLTTHQTSLEGVLEHQPQRTGQLEHQQSGIVEKIIDEETV